MSFHPSFKHLSHVFDEHIDWLGTWHRVAIQELGHRVQQADSLKPPDSFLRWQHEAVQSLPQDQPALEALSNLHDQLHKLARLVLIKTPDGEAVAADDAANVLAKYQEFMRALRRTERAFAEAASGLDTLTGLRLRNGMLDDLLREHKRFLRSGKPYCLVLMDIDHFKAVNDTHGHDAGDRVLAAVADHVSNSLRGSDDAYRIGGEEFLLCLKEADQMSALTVLERLRASLEAKPIRIAANKSINVTASFGLAVSQKDIAPDYLQKSADKALYRAKKDGRNRIVIAT